MTLYNAFGELALDATLQELLDGFTTVTDRTDNHIARALGSSETWTGEWKRVEHHGSLIYLYAITPETEAPATVAVEWSDDGAAVVATSNLTRQDVVSGALTFAVYLLISNNPQGAYYRPKLVNTATPQTSTPIELAQRVREPFVGSFGSLSQSLSLFSQALLVRAVNAGIDPDDAFKNMRTQGRHEANSSSDLLGPNEVFRGEWFQWQEDFTKIVVDVRSDVSGVLDIEFSQDASPTDGDDSSVHDSTGEVPYEPPDLLRRHVPVQSRWVRTRYTNGPTPQASFQLDAAFLVTDPGAALTGWQTLPTLKSLMAQTVSALIALDDADEPGHLRREGDALKSALVETLVSMPIRPVTSLRTGRASVGSAVPIALPSSPIADRATVRFTNASEFPVDFSESPGKIPNGADILLAGTSVEFDLVREQQIYFQAVDQGGSTAVADLDGTTVQNNVGITSPTEVLTEDDVRAGVDALADALEVTGFTAPGTFPDIQSVVLKIAGRKASSPTFEQVAFVDVVTGTAGNVGSVSSGVVTADADHFYLVSIARRNGAATITNVTGLGLTWQSIGDAVGGDTRVARYRGVGTPTGNGVVTATFSQTATAAVISVSRFSGVDLADPVENTESLAEPSTSSTYTDSIVGTVRGMAVVVAGMGRRTHTPGSGFIEQVEVSTGTGPTDQSLAVNTLSLAATGSQAYSGTFSAAVGWGVVATTLKPAPAVDPVIRVAYDVGSGIGPTALVATFSATTDTEYERDVSGDLAWDADDISALVLQLSVDEIGAASAEIDHVWIEVTEAETGNTALICFSEVGGIL